MAYEGCMDDVRKCVNGGVPDRLPVFCCTEEMDVRLAGETYEEYCSDVDILTRVTCDSIRRLDYDWAWLQVDDCIMFEPLGVGVAGEGNILRATKDYLPATRETLHHLKMPDFARDGRCPMLIEAIRRVKQEFGDTICVVGRTEAPFSSVTLLYGLTDGLMLCYDDPDLLMDTMKFFSEAQAAFGIAQFEAGADALWYGDCNAASHLISLEHYKRFAFDLTAEVAEQYRKAGGLAFYHASEEQVEFVDVMADLGCSAVSVGDGADLARCHDVVKGRAGLIGNLDPIALLCNGTPEQVAEAVGQTIDTVSRRGGHVLNSGEMVPRATPEENIRAMVRAAREKW